MLVDPGGKNTGMWGRNLEAGNPVKATPEPAGHTVHKAHGTTTAKVMEAGRSQILGGICWTKWMAIISLDLSLKSPLSTLYMDSTGSH